MYAKPRAIIIDRITVDAAHVVLLLHCLVAAWPCVPSIPQHGGAVQHPFYATRLQSQAHNLPLHMCYVPQKAQSPGTSKLSKLSGSSAESVVRRRTPPMVASTTSISFRAAPPANSSNTWRQAPQGGVGVSVSVTTAAATMRR